MNPLIWSTLLTSLLASTIITMSSNHWLLAWFGLELNTLSILPAIIKPHHPRATEATTKYFLVQATAATMILLAGIMNAWQTGHWTITHTAPLTTLMATVAIMLKLGAAPTYMWYPHVLQGVTMNTALLISTWQKLAPLTLLYTTHNHLDHTTLLLLGLLSALIGGWAGLNQTQTRTIMAFSSIAHMGWLITTITINPSVTTLMMLTYMVTTTATFLPLATTSNTITTTGTMWPASPTALTATMIALLSLGGLPPLTGFMPKWLILKELMTAELPMIAALLLMSSLLSLFFYTRLAYVTVLTTPPVTTNTEHKWRLKTDQLKHTAPMTTAATMLLPMTTTLYAVT
uniref:NADH-ubiquinone oxidoreductase chain 2 n=1 Tax=Cyrtodactylus sp. 2 PLW-2015 TaxID=1700832 RepID=A0A0K1TC85_9SAUR|nr:NADH dehydrogenase subunit 2 [Cyrtodactylus sp. 2 PLW-2015]AKV84929.1 NADH dehydrogenase subunit 2 [Cyrtodactylus sp. 2 PLW-2015]AKV84930.1 NADH dehydrogenase subunit 2 [Cyrtodactylus sp. 2 PLW-2015]